MSRDAAAQFSELGRRIRTGDTAALAALFRASAVDLRRYASSLGVTASTADDLVQEAFIKLWNRRTSIDPDRSLRAYLFITIRNLAFNEDRRHQTLRRLHGTMSPPEPASAPDALADARLLDARIRSWIQELPERRREAFVLSRYGGLSLQEIAAVMDVSAKTVENHITHALKELRRRIYEFDSGLLTP